MNFMNGTALAKFQDDLLDRCEKGHPEFSNEEKKLLVGNAWIGLASFLAPNNLVIRQYCLIGIIFKRLMDHEILHQLHIIAPDLYAEGYSYWKYTKRALNLYIDALASPEIQNKMWKIDYAFSATSYQRKGVYYPAPFADLRNEALDNQGASPIDGMKLKFLEKIGQRYKIRPYFLGLNTHVPDSYQEITTINGIPLSFRWYEGYDKKYSSKKDELKDILRPRRIFSAIHCFLRGVL